MSRRGARSGTATAERNAAAKHEPAAPGNRAAAIVPRVSSRTPPSFSCFTLAPPPGALDAATKVTRYQVDDVVPVRGSAMPGLARGMPLWRLERSGQLPLADALWVGATQHLVYTDAEKRRELTRISALESGPVAVLIPIRKSAEWWALAQDERQAYFAKGSRPGHVAIGERHAAHIYRRLYHARYLPGSEWDFLTYFEFPVEHTASFRELLAALRDTRENPEWAFVDRELEVWMTR